MKYQLKITPVEYYFFGGEKHKEEKGKINTNYFVESLPYPQQTTILGMVRFLLLMDNGLLSGHSIEQKDEANKLIGEKSFHCGEVQQSFGKINSVSCLYFLKDNMPYFFCPSDILFDYDDGILSNGIGKFNAKDHGHLITDYISNGNDEIKLSELICDIETVGNEKDRKGVSLKNAFYKQNLKSLKDKWSFAVNIDIDVELKKKDYFLQFGGEKSFFKIDVFNIPAELTYPSGYKRAQPHLICQSDCFIDLTELEGIAFAVNGYVSFRNLTSTTSTNNYNALKANKDINQSMVRSKRFQLLKRGSVLYFHTIEHMKKAKEIIELQNGTSIGFNNIYTNQL